VISVKGLLVGCLALLPAVAFASDCDYNRERMAEYLALCASRDGCASRAQMQRIVDESCGASSSGRRATPAPARPAAEAPPAAAAARKALDTRARSAAEAERQCRILVAYRDGAMAGDFERAVARWSAADEARRHLQELREEVGGHFRTGTLLANGVVVLQFIKLKANLIGNLLRIDPATGTGVRFVERGWGKVLARIEQGQTIAAMLNDPASLVVPIVTETMRDSVPVIGPLVKTFADVAQDLDDVMKSRKEAVDFYSEFDARTRYLDRELARYAERALKERAAWQLINELRAAIDARCSGRGSLTVNPPH
jgi:hypothetical protein